MRLRLGHKRLYLLSNPHHIEHVLVKTGRGFDKGYYKDPVLRLGLGNGLIMSEGDFWRRQRRLVQPAFHHERVAAYGEVMVAYAERMLDTWRADEERDVHGDMSRLTLEIVAKTLFDTDPGTTAAQDVGRALEVGLAEYIRELSRPVPVPENLPTPGRLRLKRALGTLDEIIYRIIREHRASGEDRGDLLSMLLQVRDTDGTGMTDRQLRDEVVNFFVAGYETTANVLSWAWVLLSERPEADHKLLSELRRVLGDRSPGPADLARLPYAGAVVKEVMRLYPPLWFIARVATEDGEVGPYRVPAGTELWMSQWVAHRDGRHFDNPETFEPNRWLSNPDGPIHRYAYFPFGGGPRLCIGQGFATMEAVLVLATVAQRFRLELPSEHRVEIQTSVTVRPKGGVPVRPRLRDASA